MPGGREEPFKTALRALRERLRDGAFPPGRRIAAVDVADSLRLSATPVREALSRLAGEGLLDELRGQGFYVPLYTSADVADLYRLSWAQLRISLCRERPRVGPQGCAQAFLEQDPVSAVERLFSSWMAETGSRVLAGCYRRTQAQLAPLRRLEHEVFADLEEEAVQLLALTVSDSVEARAGPIELFHQRRIAAAERLAALAAIRTAGARS